MLECLLVGGVGGGGEEVFLRDLERHPPPRVRYWASWGCNEPAEGTSVARVAQVAFNRLVHPLIYPLPGLRSFRLERHFDVIHVHNHLFRFTGRQVPPVVMTVGGGSYPHYLKTYLGWSEERVRRLYVRASRILPALGVGNEVANWKMTAGIVVFSQVAADELLAVGVPAGLISVIPPGFADPGPVSRSWDDDPFTVLFVGRDHVRKGADLAIQAVRRLREEGAPVRAILVGESDFGVQGDPGFETHAWVERETLYKDMYRRAHVLTLPSRAEGFGFAAVEAMAFGLPVLLSSQGAFPEILGDSDGGLLLPTGQEPPLRLAIKALMDDRTGARFMGEAARERFLQRFTLRAHREALQEVFFSAAAGSAYR